MRTQAYLSIIVAVAGIVNSVPITAEGAVEGAANLTIGAPEADGAVESIINATEADVVPKKRTGGRFKPIWVVGYDEDEEKGEHIGFRLFSDGDKDSEPHEAHMKPHNAHVKAHDNHDHESSFWYYYYTY
ncbi:hypothetical protein F4777DRAFT_584105 [Nemania sp. FL0916]|nr:hypothetical protein F4777DRAFT_584105 [Nemania sp. FL0916]